MPRYSVLINNYNYAGFVAEAIDSALGQSATDAEVIVVDDGSRDGSAEVLRRYDARATIVFQENHGQAGAINAGVAASSGEFLCFLDADDRWTPGKLARVGAAFDADPGAALVYHRLQPVTVDGRPTLKLIPRTLCAGDLSSRLARSAGWWPFPMTSAVSVRRSAWEAAGPIPETFRISADAFIVGIYPFLGRVVAIADALGEYRIHRNNWYRAEVDEADLRKRMAHWRATIDATNAFLARRGDTRRLDAADHFPLAAADAQLGGLTPAGRLRLALAGVRFGGEPHLLRRMRDAARAARNAPSPTARARQEAAS